MWGGVWGMKLSDLILLATYSQNEIKGKVMDDKH